MYIIIWMFMYKYLHIFGYKYSILSFNDGMSSHTMHYECSTIYYYYHHKFDCNRYWIPTKLCKLDLNPKKVP